MKIFVLGVGMGPQHVTPEVSAALRSCDYIIAAHRADNGLLALRHAIAASHGVPVVEVPDLPRDPGSPFHYEGAGAGWQEARVAAYEPILRERGGTAGFLIWGDPSLYDSTVGVASALASRLSASYEVLPGISAPQLFAARHRIVLHEIGRPLHITTGRRFREAVAAGQENILVMLLRSLDLDGLDDWSLWWAANLGTESEELVAGRVADVRSSVAEARDRAKAAVGWVLDICLLRRGERGPFR